jgi:Cof subfamily protein (haloacid dehalogenase superfamily)
MGKILFFDVDGTLLNFNGEMSLSTQIALNKAKENGHHIYICTGRSRFALPRKLLQFNFNGIVAAAGAYVECEGSTIFHHIMPKEDVNKVLALCKKEDLMYSCQTKDQILMTEKSKQRVIEYFKEKKGLQEEQIKQIPLFINNMNKGISPEIEKNIGCIEKIVYRMSAIPIFKVKETLGSSMEVTMLSFENGDESSGEITCAGIHKALGMQKVLDYYGVEQKESIAFGDGPNDIEMMQYAGTSVAMGNATKRVKELADIVTEHVNEDGILHGLKRLEVI